MKRKSRMKIRQNLRHLRKQVGLSFRELGKETGVLYITLHNIEVGKVQNPRIEDIDTLAKFFHVSLDDFVNIDLKSKSTGDNAVEVKDSKF